MRTLGIDPGLSGAFAIVDDATPVEWTPAPRMGDKGDIDWAQVYDWLSVHQIDYAVIEKVGAMPGQGVSSMFRFGLATGGAHAVVQALKIPYELVTPQRWKKAMLPDMDRSSKDVTGVYLKRRFPTHDFRASERARKPHDGICDAVCMALYAHERCTAQRS